MFYYTYILATKKNGVLYVGVTNDLGRRMREHKLREHPGFSARYHVDKLVYFEEFSDVRDAIAREKKLKGLTRAKKLALINEQNPDWKDYSEGLF
ncbi:MAG: GIY-YIG nuclease family protein [Clostridia bacterium]|nr:GIY-YIG nuclease family protein [Clostridia bacterium]